MKDNSSKGWPLRQEIRAAARAIKAHHAARKKKAKSNVVPIKK